MPKVGIHVNQEQPVGRALSAGFEALGYKVVWRNGASYRQGEAEAFDVVVTDGLRGNRADLVRDYGVAGIPALVVDFGYLRRKDENSDGYWSLGLGGLNWLPPCECPADRFDALNLTIAEPGNGTDTIIAGQMIGDANHPFGDAAQMEKWAIERAAQEFGTVLFRPHPRSPTVSPTGMEIDRLPLAESLAKAAKVVTYSSNIGNDALLAGVMVECHGTPTYAGIGLDDRVPYFNRLAYAQWTLDEIASGEAIAFVLGVNAGIYPEVEPVKRKRGRPRKNA